MFLEHVTWHLLSVWESSQFLAFQIYLCSTIFTSSGILITQPLDFFMVSSLTYFLHFFHHFVFQCEYFFLNYFYSSSILLLFMSYLLLNPSTEFLPPNYCIVLCVCVYCGTFNQSFKYKRRKGKLQVGETISINGWKLVWRN